MKSLTLSHCSRCLMIEQIQHNKKMESKRSRHFFTIGSEVEVTTKEEGFIGSWYTATIINPPKPNSTTTTKTTKTTKTHFWIEYKVLVTEEDNQKSLTERVHVSCLRPLPPRGLTNHKGLLKLHDVVEASYRDGWWTGVIVKVIEDDADDGSRRFLVAFDCPYEEIVFRKHELRLHINWTDGKWVRSQKKETVVAIRSTSETELVTQLESVVTKVRTAERIPSSTKKLKKASTGSEGMNPLKKLKRDNAAQAPPVFTPCEFNSISTKISSEKADCVLVSTDKGDGNVDSQLESSDRHKHSTKSSSPMKNLDPSEENGGKSNQGTKIGRQKKKLIQRFLTSLQGDEPTGEEEHVHEKVIVLGAASEAELLEATSNFSAGTQKAPSGEAFVVSEKDYGTHELETTFDKRGVCPSQALALCSESRDQQENVTSCPAVIAGTNSTLDKNQSWPFVKSSGVWKTVDSMDIFTRMPQMPHFSPLNEFAEHSREKLAICMMMKFAYEVDKISRLSLDDLKNTSIVNHNLDSLKEFESHGFDIMEVEVHLKHLLRESEIQGKLEEVASQIRKCQAEKTAAENDIRELVKQIKSLEEKRESAKSVKCLKDQELANLQSAKGLASGEIQSLQLDFKRKAAASLCEVASESKSRNVDHLLYFLRELRAGKCQGTIASK